MPGDTVEEMLSGGADVDALMESGQIDGEWRSPSEVEADRQANLAAAANLLELAQSLTPVEIIF